MTVSIGVVTNERRHFTHAAQVSELATEMKSYAKTLPGSVYVVDRRQDRVASGVGRAGVIRARATDRAPRRRALARMNVACPERGSATPR